MTDALQLVALSPFAQVGAQHQKQLLAAERCLDG